MNIPTQIWNIYSQAGSSLCASGNYASARTMFEAAVESCSLSKKLEPQRVQSIILLADSYALTGEFKAAEKQYRRALNLMARTNLPPTAKETMKAHVLEKLGYICSSDNRISEGIQLLERSIRVSQRVRGQADASIMNRLLELSALHERQGSLSQAVETLQQAKMIKTKSIHNIYDGSMSRTSSTDGCAVAM